MFDIFKALLNMFVFLTSTRGTSSITSSTDSSFFPARRLQDGSLLSSLENLECAINDVSQRSAFKRTSGFL